MKQGIPILMYSGFFNKKRKPTFSNNISIKLFKEQMEYLYNNGYTCITLEDAETAYKRNEFDKKAFCITFDNGFYSQYKYAVPVLDKYNWKATFFVPTLVIGEKNRKKLKDTFELDLLPSDKMMTWKQLEYLIKEEHFVQSHGCFHHRDNLKSLDMIEVEVIESKHVLENILGYEIEYFAYPFGAYNTMMIQALKQSNYQMAFTNYPGILNSSTDIFRTPRIAISDEDTIATFKSKLSTGYASSSKALFSKAVTSFTQFVFLKDLLNGILKRIAG